MQKTSVEASILSTAKPFCRTPAISLRSTLSSVIVYSVLGLSFSVLNIRSISSLSISLKKSLPIPVQQRGSFSPMFTFVISLWVTADGLGKKRFIITMELLFLIPRFIISPKWLLRFLRYTETFSESMPWHSGILLAISKIPQPSL